MSVKRSSLENYRLGATHTLGTTDLKFAKTRFGLWCNTH